MKNWDKVLKEQNVLKGVVHSAYVVGSQLQGMNCHTTLI